MQKRLTEVETMIQTIQRWKIRWEGARWWTEKQGMTPEELSRGSGVGLERIKKGFRGEPVAIGITDLRLFAHALGLTSRREGRFCEETVESLTDEEIEDLFTSVVHPRQRNLWSDE